MCSNSNSLRKYMLLDMREFWCCKSNRGNFIIKDPVMKTLSKLNIYLTISKLLSNEMHIIVQFINTYTSSLGYLNGFTEEYDRNISFGFLQTFYLYICCRINKDIHDREL